MNALADRRYRRPATWSTVLILALSIPLLALAEKKEFRYILNSAGSLSLANQKGSVTVKPSTGRQVVITADHNSDKVEVDSSQNGSRINVRTHNLGKASGEELRVDYEIQVPADTSVSIDSEGGQIHVENLHSNVNVESEDGDVDVRGVNNGTVQVQSVSGRVVLTDLHQTRVQVTSTGGNVQLSSVFGPNVTVKSTSGNIRYDGDFLGGGTYLLTNHSGDIEVMIPSNASVDLTARSVKGKVENDFPLRKPIHSSFQLTEGKALAGTSNSGASSVELRSFSGRIRVKKQ